jgi:hypothetical protein
LRHAMGTYPYARVNHEWVETPSRLWKTWRISFHDPPARARARIISRARSGSNGSGYGYTWVRLRPMRRVGRAERTWTRRPPTRFTQISAVKSACDSVRIRFVRRPLALPPVKYICVGKECRQDKPLLIPLAKDPACQLAEDFIVTVIDPELSTEYSLLKSETRDVRL